MSLERWVRPCIYGMSGYVPGEQPAAGQRVVKLNTNENPHAVPPVVLEALAVALNEGLRLYPPPDAAPVREAAARAFGVDARGVVAGNGSDDLLTMIMRACVDPGETVAAPDPTYTLYPTLTRMQGGNYQAVPWLEDGGLPVAALAETGAKVIFVTRPNAPTGHAVPLAQVAALCRTAPGVVVLDEAYGEFADDHGLPLLAEHPNLIVTRSFSKSRSLAGLRIGLGFMSPALAEQLHKVRDSYNLDRLAQVAAVAVLEHLPAFQFAIETVKAERIRTTLSLTARGFRVAPSQANFVLAQIPAGPLSGAEWVALLKERGILVRHFPADPRLADKLRITIGTAAEMSALLAAVDWIQGQAG
ncbi:MAG: histidinol-phosphate transaminase [Magnetococcales bacterium]|nr:histidinol-phosphate transaminase [Magnetococcales bacterium]